MATRSANYGNHSAIHRTVSRSVAILGIAGGFVVLPFLLIGIAFNNTGIIYSALCFTAVLIPLYVGLRRGQNFDPFEPINLIAFAILFGSAFRSVWIQLSDSSRVTHVMWRTNFDDVVWNMPLILLSVGALALGYAIFPSRLKLEKLNFFSNFTMTKQRFWLAIGSTVLISFIGLPWMIAEYGISFDAGLLGASHKHLATYTDDSGEVIYGSGFQRFLAFGAAHGFMFFAAALIAGLLRLRSGVVLILAGLGLLAVLPPFLLSSRSLIVLIFLNLCIFAYYYKRISMWAILAVGISGIFVLSAMGALREENQRGAATEEASTADRILGSGNSIDFIRTSAIMDLVPGRTDYLLGSSYIALIAAPIPRAVWPNKPQIGLGGYVKGEIFGEDVRLNGWPSGLIAEGWINFGLFGLFLPLLLFGMLLRLVYESVRPFLGA